MAKKLTPKEVDLVESTAGAVPKKETFAVRWFNEVTTENADEIRKISELTARSAEEQFSIGSSTGNYELYACIYYQTMLNICQFIASKQSKYKEFSMQVANSLNIGYTNNEDDENEKVGNFMVFLEYIGSNIAFINNDSINEATTAASSIGWKNLNVKQNVEFIKEIQEMAYADLNKNFKIDIRTSEAIIPIFCVFHDHINNVLKLKYMEAEGTGVSEVKLNILNLFDAYYSFDVDEDKEIYEYTPSINLKLALKSDSKAIAQA